MDFDCSKKSLTIPKGGIRIRKSKKNRQDNDQKIKVQKDKHRSTKHSHGAKDRETRTPIKLEVNSGASERQTVPPPLIYELCV